MPDNAVEERIASTIDRALALAERLIAMREKRAASIKLSRRQQAIINAIGHGKLIGRKIAAEMALECGSSFQQSLSAMVRQGILGNDQHGYSVTSQYKGQIQDEDEE